MNYLICTVLGLGEILLIVACALIVLSALITAIVRKARGKSSCGDDCGCCSGCSCCRSRVKADDKDLRKM